MHADSHGVTGQAEKPLSVKYNQYTWRWMGRTIPPKLHQVLPPEIIVCLKKTRTLSKLSKVIKNLEWTFGTHFPRAMKVNCILNNISSSKIFQYTTLFHSVKRDLSKLKLLLFLVGDQKSPFTHWAMSDSHFSIGNSSAKTLLLNCIGEQILLKHSNALTKECLRQHLKLISKQLTTVFKNSFNNTACYTKL